MNYVLDTHIVHKECELCGEEVGNEINMSEEDSLLFEESYCSIECYKTDKEKK